MTIVPTPEQKVIIDYPLLPLRVTAGAGTGKTTTMALRLRHLVASGRVEPEQALGITFTNKAAEELSARLRSFLPELSAEGREVEVSTYHGFAYGVLREFGALVGVDRSAAVVTPGYTRQLLRDALAAGAHTALDLTAPGRRVDELATLAGQLGDHLLGPDAVRGVGEDPEVAAARTEMADALAAYAARKRELGVVDYADLIAAAHRLVTSHPEIAGRIRDRYRVVLLDEYQDTNPAQREMLRALFGGGFPVTAVGDADQTIYEWRGASLQNFADFPEHFPAAGGAPAHTERLTLNRRSTRRVIDLANRVRGEIGRAGDLGDLVPLPDAADGTVRAGWFRTAVDEARWVAAEVRRLHEDGTAWRDIGILFRKHRQIGLVRDALERQGVPVEVAALGGLLEVPEVADLHAWLRLLGRPDDAPALMRVLLGAAYRLGMGDLAPLAAWVRGHHDDAGDDLGGIGWALLEAVDSLEECEGLDDRTAGRLRSFRATHRSLLTEAQGVSLVELCRLVLDRTGAWPEVEALDDAARLSARLNLYRFLDLAEEWSPLEGRPSLAAFLDYLDLLGEEGAADELDTARVSGEDAVAMLTVHRAKGLEWPVVFLPALCSGTFPSRAHTYADPVARAWYLPHEVRLDAGYLPALPADAGERREVVRGLHDDQEWRTAYVAVTRAAHTLVATGAAWYTEKTAKGPSRLYELAAETEGAEIVSAVEDPGSPPATLRFEAVDADGPDPLFPGGWREALRTAVEDPGSVAEAAAAAGAGDAVEEAAGQLALTLDGLPEPGGAPSGPAPFRTSVTGLVTFAACPRRFHWSEVDRLPRRPSPALRRGVEVHRRIELHHRGAVPFDEADEAFYDLDAAGDTATGGADAGPGGPGPFEVFLGSRFAERRPIMVEAPFELQTDGGVLAGRIDAVYEPEPGTWEVVDFKSGRRTDDPSRRVQLQAYAVAVADAGFAAGTPERVRVSFAYLGGGLEEVGEDVDDSWLDEARSRIDALMTGAAAGERDARPGDRCRSCDFLRFCDRGTAWLQGAGERG
ncbi:MAG: ATP-dependent helicase [Actinobacteria bacterium]|nr:ATP-dependent helicase [Actinomycetota bacterium]